MRKAFLTLVFVLASVNAFAQCANSVAQLRTIVEHADVPLRWIETSEKNASRILSMSITDGAAGPVVRLTLPDGRLWANLSGQICVAGNARTLVMSVNKRASSFGPGAPWAVRNLGGVPRSVNLNLSSDYSSLQVRASSYRGTYRPR